MNIGGYDEEFAGKVYSTDGLFRKYLKREYKRDPIHLEDVTLIRYGREVIPDASTTEFVRGQDDEIMDEVRARNKFKMNNSIPPKVLTFPWDRVI